MRSSFASAGLMSLAVSLAAGSASAATLTISDKQTTPFKTSTAVSNAPGDISITTAGSLMPTGGAAVTIDSANSVTNAGSIQIVDADNSTGILATSNAGTITNSGTITINETYTPTDTDNDGDLDGSFAKGSNRYGIHVTGAFTGNVTNSGTITVEGNKSTGIAIDGRLTGSLTQNGSIGVVGDDSTGISVADVSGDARIAGTITVQGQNARAVSLGGNIDGALTIQGAISATGYRYVSPPSDTSKLDGDDLLQGGAAVTIAGNVGGGVVFAVPPADTDPNSTDDDKDGIPDASEGSAKIASYGAAPAVQIGAADHAVSIGAVKGDVGKNGIVVNGSISGNGIYDKVAATGMAIGGLGGGVTVAGGIAITGDIDATANNANATALHIGRDATVPTITNGGTIVANGGGADGTLNSAILIDAGANVSTITNSGTIVAQSADTAASSTAILDRSGTVTSVTNTGVIGATGAGSGRNTAIDLSASTGGATVRQAAGATGAAAPAIVGDIRFGAGNDTLDLAAGTMTGNVAFGGGSDIFGVSSGATFTGSLSSSTGVALTVNGGTFNATGAGVSVRTLNVGNGTLGVGIDSSTGVATLYQVAGTATFDAGSLIEVRISDVLRSVGDYTVVKAGSIVGAGNLSLSGVVVPYIYKGSLATDAAAGTVKVSIDRKSTAELGLNGSGSRAWDAIYTALGNDKGVGDSFLAITGGSEFRQAVRHFLPDHAGGAFESVTSASRATARMLADPDAPIAQAGRIGIWLQQVAWGRSKSIGDVSGYHVSGWGVTGGAEYSVGRLGRFGGSLAYLAGQDNDNGTSNSVKSNQYELAGTWRGDWGGLHAFARGSAALVNFRSDRRFNGLDGTDAVIRTADGKWHSRLYSGASGVSYRVDFGSFSIRPQVAVDYYKLREKGYAERGSQEAFALRVASRDSNELAASGAVALGYLLFDERADDGGYLRFEIEGGRRQIASGRLGSTTARFVGGQDFTLVGEDRASGWTGAVRAKGGSNGFTVSGEVNAERQNGYAALALRVGLQAAF